MNKKPASKAAMFLFCLVAGLLSAAAFSVETENYVGLGATPAATTSYLWTALGVCFVLLLRLCYGQLQLRPHKTEICLGLLFGLMNAFCSVLFAVDSWRMGTLRLLLTAAKGLLQGIPMTAALLLLHYAVTCGILHLRTEAQPSKAQPSKAQRSELLCRAEALLDRHPVLPLAGLLVLCWLPYLVVYYPGTVCWDLGEMVAAFFGMLQPDTMHPVFVTGLLGGLVWFGRLFGSDNLGVLLYMLLQTAAFAWALASVAALCRALRIRPALWVSVLAFFALTPIFGGYAQFISTDTLYTAAVTLFSVQALRLLLHLDGEAHLCSGMRLFGWGLLACLMRLNGFLVMAASAVIVTLVLLLGKHPVSPKKRRCAIGGMVLCLVCSLGYSQLLIPALPVVENTASGIYSVCFQQSARVLRDCADAVTPQEYAAIDAVLDAERLPKLYDTAVSDPVKYTFRQWGDGPQAEKAALADYRTAWLAMAKKYPLSYLEAFVAGNMSYYTFQPKIDGETYNHQGGARLVFETYTKGEDPRYLHTQQPDLFYTARIVLAALARGGRHIPGVSFLYCCAFYTWLCIALAVSLWRQKRGWLLYAFAPVLLTFVCCLFSPVNDYFRYFLPIVTLTPLLLCTAAAPVKEKANTDNQ